MTGSEPRSTDGGETSYGNDNNPEDSSSSAQIAADDQAEPPEIKPGFWAGLTNLFTSFRRHRRNKAGSLRENLEDELSRETHGDDTAFTADERELLANILQLRGSRVEDVMIPRADIQAVEDTVAIADLMEYFRESGHSRMPVYHENLDDPRGMVHIKDLMAYIAEQAGAPKRNGRRKNGERLENGSNGKDTAAEVMNLATVDLSRPLCETGLVRPLHFVPPSMSSSDLMKQMQVTRVQMALVIDEYGGTDGLVSLEDIVETVVGDIEDEHDEAEEAMITSLRDGVWAVDPRIDLDDLEEEIKTGWDLEELAEDVDTLGGLLFTLLGRVPVRGELISDRHLPGYEFEVMDADPRRIKRLKVYKRRHDQRAAAVRTRSKRAEAAE